MRRRRRKLIGKRGAGDVGLKGIGKSKKPCTGTRDTVKTEVSDPMTIVRRRIKQVVTDLGFDLGRQTFLGR